jgi:hypothetical protein
MKQIKILCLNNQTFRSLYKPPIRQSYSYLSFKMVNSWMTAFWLGMIKIRKPIFFFLETSFYMFIKVTHINKYIDSEYSQIALLATD